jgi:hypothetical protein
MTTEEIINQKADYLIRVGLIDYIETTDDNYKKGLSLIEKDVNEIDFKSYKIQFLDRIISELEHHKKVHQENCPERKKENPICYFELHYDEAIKFCNQKKKKLILEQAMMSFDDKIKIIFQELATRPNRQGDLKEILKECDIPYIENDLWEYINYFKKTEYVNTEYITKSGLDVVLNQSGLDLLKEKPKKNPEQIIHIGENYQNSVVAKGNHINQSGLSFSPHHSATIPNIDEQSQPKKNVASNAQKPASPTKRIQTWQLIVAVIGVLIALTMVYLKLNEKI